MRSRWPCRWLLLLGVLACAPAWADGGFFKQASRLRAELAEPDQKALILHRDGRETLILQATYRGASEHFGWVVPVPNRPKVSPASATLFYDLARLTEPRHEPTAGRQSMNAAGPAGVQVLEQREVGPYDITVLAASDARALTDWLRQHRFAAPADTARVLQPYVDRGWFYVAARIHIESDPAAVLRAIDPTVADPRQAPEVLARKLVRLAAEDRPAGRKIAEAMDRAAGAPAGGAPVPEQGALSMGAGGTARELYMRYANSAAPLEDRLVPKSSMAVCIAGCKEQVPATKFRAAAQAAGLYRGQYDGELVEDLRRSVFRDVWQDVPYARSQINRFHAALGGIRSGPAAGDFADRYETVRKALRLGRAAPLPTEAQDWLRDVSERPQGYVPFDSAALQDFAAETDHTYEALKAQAGATLDAVADALAGGTIAPLRLEFAADEPVYPLRLSSLNPGPTEIQLYLLAEHRMGASGFDARFAGRLVLKDVPTGELRDMLRPGTAYLTKLQATMDSSEMTQDVTFSQHRSDRPYHPWAPGEGPFLGPYRGWVLALLLVGGGIEYRRRRLARRRKQHGAN